MNIAMLTSECNPFAKVGGIGDVVGSLPKALEREGQTIKIFMPKYGIIDEKKFKLEKTEYSFNEIYSDADELVDVYKSVLPDSNVEVYFLDSETFFRDKEIYTPTDDDKRFVFFSLASLQLFKEMNWKPDIIHCHDWHVGMVPLKLKDITASDPFYKGMKSVFTIHNLGYEGSAEPSILDFANIDPDKYPSIAMDLKDNDIDTLLEGIAHADMVTTVSETYAKEILTPEYGQGMLEVLQTRKDNLVGILNGIDEGEWNPETDQDIIAQFTIKNPLPKAENKLALQKKHKLTEDQNIPLFIIVSRLVEQKGMHLVSNIAEDIVKMGAQLIVLGTGESAVEEDLTRVANQFPDAIKANITFDLKLAREMYAGADMLLIPSMYEPCGLTQMIAMRYGTIPVVRATGGLKDTVIDYAENSEQSTGFVFEEKTSEALLEAMTRAVDLYTNDRKSWEQMMNRCMNRDFSWDASARKYIDLYKKTVTL
jgi:starch synthase